MAAGRVRGARRRATTGSRRVDILCASRRYTSRAHRACRATTRRQPVTRLSVNVNKIAVLRNSRGGGEPDPVEAARAALAAGCARHHRASAAGPAPHPRRRRRAHRGGARRRRVQHRRQSVRAAARDVSRARRARARGAARAGDAGAGWRCADHVRSRLRSCARRARASLPLVRAFKEIGCRVSLFMDADSPDIERVAGARRRSHRDLHRSVRARVRARATRRASSMRARARPSARARAGSASMPGTISTRRISAR